MQINAAHEEETEETQRYYSVLRKALWISNDSVSYYTIPVVIHK